MIFNGWKCLPVDSKFSVFICDKFQNYLIASLKSLIIKEMDFANSGTSAARCDLTKAPVYQLDETILSKTFMDFFINSDPNLAQLNSLL